MSENLFRWFVVICLVSLVVLVAWPGLGWPPVEYKGFMTGSQTLPETLNVYHQAGWSIDGVTLIPEVKGVYVLMHK